MSETERAELKAKALALMAEREAELSALDETLMFEVLRQERNERRRIARARISQEKKDGKRPRKPRRPAIAPRRNVYRAITSGAYKPQTKPRSSVDDRKYVPGVLRHWRLTHDLTPSLAQARVGLSPKSCSWRHYEAGIMVPSYNMLLRIIAATGLGTLMEVPQAGDVAPELALEANRAAYQRHVRARRARRARAPQ